MIQVLPTGNLLPGGNKKVTVTLVATAAYAIAGQPAASVVIANHK